MNQKLLSVVIPCYNSEAYMEHCIESLLTGGTRVEIIIVNDGSKDHTGEIANRYAMRFPHIVKAVHQPNGGHGEAVNTGIRNATGRFFKVVDSDDWVDAGAYLGILDVLDIYKDEIDMMISNFVYEKQGAKHKKVMEYTGYLPVDKVFTWEDIKPFPIGKYLLMHSVIYRTELIRQTGLELPKHTFYVDNLYMYEPLPLVERIYYINSDLYLYYVGSDEQSVNEKNVIKRIDQQILVTKMVIDSHDLNEVEKKSKRLYRYMLHELSMLICICNVFLSIKGDRESVEKQKNLWRHLKAKDLRTYKKMRYGAMSALTHLPGKLGRKTTVGIYRIVNKIYKPN